MITSNDVETANKTVNEKFDILDYYVLEGAVLLNDWSEHRKERIRQIVNKIRPYWAKEIRLGEWQTK